MFVLDSMEDGVRVLHLHDVTPDAMLGLHLKQMCRTKAWSYGTHSMDSLPHLDLQPTDVVVLDFFARPLRHATLRDDLESLVAHAEASFLFVFRRTFSSSIEPIHGINCEYCFLGLDDIEEITFRVRLVQTRTERFSPAADFAL